jgi:hypothetical protein
VLSVGMASRAPWMVAIAWNVTFPQFSRGEGCLSGAARGGGMPLRRLPLQGLGTSRTAVVLAPRSRIPPRGQSALGSPPESATESHKRDSREPPARRSPFPAPSRRSPLLGRARHSPRRGTTNAAAVRARRLDPCSSFRRFGPPARQHRVSKLRLNTRAIPGARCREQVPGIPSQLSAVRELPVSARGRGDSSGGDGWVVPSRAHPSFVLAGANDL